MKIQCGSCGFVGLFAGGGIVPTTCPVCSRSTLTQPAEMMPCPHCGVASAVVDKVCPHCGIDKVKQDACRENGKLAIPDGSPPPYGT